MPFLALSEVVGRKIALIIGGIIFTIGGTVQTASFYLWSPESNVMLYKSVLLR